MDSTQTIKALIKGGESESLELKLRINNETIGKTVCGFLNCNGGSIIIGVADNKSIIGLPNANAALEALRSYLGKGIIPEAPIDLRVEAVNNKPVLIVKVWAGARKPYIFLGTIFYRKNDRTVQATSQEVSDLIHSRKDADLHWERGVIPNLTINDLDLAMIEETIELSAEGERGKIFKVNQVEQFLSYYGLIQNGNLTNAAAALFAKQPARYVPQIRSRVAVLNEGKTGSGFKTDRLFEGNLFENTKKIEEFLSVQTRLDRKFDKIKWERTKGFQYPMDAVSEGVLNSLVHRDYSSANSSSNILIYPDHLEISNTGKLPPELSPSDLKRSHSSYPKNPDIAHIFFLRGYIDKIGRGTLKIIEACGLAGLHEPKWRTEGSMVKLTFFANFKLSKTEGANKGVIVGATGGVSKELAKKIEGVIVGVTEGVTEGVKERVTAIVSLLSKRQGLRISHMALELNVPDKSLERYIKQLKDAGIIEFKGASKSGGYFLTRKTTNALKK